MTTTTSVQASATSIDLVNAGQACDHLGVTTDGLIRLVNAGRLAAYNIGGSIRFRLADVLADSATLAATV